MDKLKFKVFLIALLAAAMYVACHKTDQRANTSTSGEMTIRFFNEHRSDDPVIRIAASFIQKNNDRYHFVENTVKQVGYPDWDKSIVTSKREGQATSSDSSVIVYVPFVRDNENFVNTSLLVKITPKDTAFKFLCNWQYAGYGFDTASGKWNARDVFHLFAMLDREVFGRTAFKITDERLFGKPGPGKEVVAKLRPQTPSQQRLFLIATECHYIDVCYGPDDIEWCNGECYMNCEYYTHTEFECTDTWFDDGFPPGGPGGTAGGQGGQSGSGGSGGGATPPQCNGSNPARASVAAPCGPGWTPTGGGSNPPVEPVDSMLAGYSRAFRHIGDSIYNNLSLPGNIEYFFAGAKNATNG